MKIIQQPDILSFAGNVNDFVIEDVAKSLEFKLSVDEAVIVNEVYVADGGMVRVSMKDVVDCFLSISVPRSDSDYMIQFLAVKKFKAEVENTVIEFTVVKGGISNVAESSAVFLKTQWLTLQPQEKKIVTHQPEYLSYYAVEAGSVRMTVYFSDGSESETLLTLEAGNLYTVDVSYLKISGKFDRVVGCYDVWVENEAGQRLTYVQRYILSQSNTETNVYLFENTLGGIDSVVFTGRFTEKIQTEGTVTTVLEESTDSDIDLNFSCEQNTGFIPSIDYARWLRGFFVSKQRYHVAGALRRIYLRESENGFTKNSLNDFTFEFFYSKQTKYDVVTRNRDELPYLLEFPEVDSLPFLAPRLAEFPIAVVADDLMLPVQYAFENAWRRISVAAIAQAVSKETIDHIDMSSYWKKTELVREGLYLKFLDQFIRVKLADDSVLWDGHAFNDYLDQPVRRKDDVRFESVEVGDYLSGLLGSGAKIDKDGHAEVRSLTAWDHVEFPELRFNRVDVVSGELWNSIAFGVIDKVDTASRVATVKLVEGELLGLHVNDICRGIFHFHGENNDVDKVDDCGFLQLAGFSTSYFTPVQLVGRDKFKYTLRSGTSVHPAPGMKFAVYGNFKDKTRQASAYRTRTYTRYLRDVDTWVINADRHVYAQFGDINGLTVNGVTLRGHGSFQRNSYFTDSVIQIQGDEFKGADAYSVVLSSYEGVVNLNADGGISTPVSGEANVTSGGRNVISGGKNVVTRQYALSTLVQAHKGGEPLMFSETPGEGYFSVSLNAVGCAATVENGVVRVVGVTDTRKAHVNITVNCEGESVFDKRYTVVFTRDGEKGATGAMPRYRGKFVTGMEYVYNGEYRDIINHLIDGDERTFQVRHRGSVVTVPPSSSQGDDNWEVASEFNFLATGLILSKDAIIDLLQGNKILIKKENGTVAAGLAGGSVPFWIGGEGPEDSPVWINEEGGGQLAGGNIKWNKDGSGSLAEGGISWDAGGNSKFSGVLESKLSYSNFYRIFEGYDDEDDYHEWPEYYDPAIHGGNVMLDSVGVSRSLKLPPAIEWDGLFASFFTPFPLSRFVVDISLITSEGFIYDGWDPWEDGIKTTFSTRSGLCEIQSVDGKWYIKDKSKGTIK